jgi:hypothetical protein
MMCRFQMCRYADESAHLKSYPIICTFAHLESAHLIAPNVGQPQPFLKMPHDEMLLTSITAANMISLFFFIAYCAKCERNTKNTHTNTQHIAKHIVPIAIAPGKNF